MPFLPRVLGLAVFGLAASSALAEPSSDAHSRHRLGAAERPTHVQLGPRPFFLVDDMAESPLRRELQRCARRGDFTPRDFSIGHRGASMQFPEHTVESYTAAARMGGFNGAMESLKGSLDSLLIAIGSQFLHHRKDAAYQFRIQSRCRFIKENHIRFDRHSPGNAHPLLLSAGKLRRIIISPVRQAHFL